MATSNSITLTTSRDEIITEALELLGVIEPGVAPDATQITTCSRTLNNMIKAWQMDGLQVFTIKRGYLFLERDKTEYTMSATGDHWTYDFESQDLAADAASGQAQIEVTDASVMAVGGTIGLELDDGTVVWDTIATLDGGNLVSLTSNLTAAASEDNDLRYYLAKADKPLKPVEASLRNEANNDRPLIILSRKEWSELSNKSYQGSATEVYFDDRSDDPVLFVWPQSSQDFDMVILWVQRYIETFDTGTDEPDYQAEWFLPLSFNLAELVAPKFGVPTTNKNFKAVQDNAIVWYDKAQGFDSGPESRVWFEVDTLHSA